MKLQLCPYFKELFCGIEFGGVGREPFERETGKSFVEFADGGSFVLRAVVPDDDDLAGDLFEEYAEEECDAGGIEGAIDEGLEVQVAAERLWSDGRGGDMGRQPRFAQERRRRGESWTPVSSIITRMVKIYDRRQKPSVSSLFSLSFG